MPPGAVPPPAVGPQPAPPQVTRRLPAILRPLATVTLVLALAVATGMVVYDSLASTRGALSAAKTAAVEQRITALCTTVASAAITTAIPDHGDVESSDSARIGVVSVMRQAGRLADGTCLTSS